MRYARLFADDRGESRFDDIEIDFKATDSVQSAPPLDFSGDAYGISGRVYARAGWVDQRLSYLVRSQLVRCAQRRVGGYGER